MGQASLKGISQAAQDAAAWNARRLQGKDIDTTAPDDGDVLMWDGTANKWTPGNLAQTEASATADTTTTSTTDVLMGSMTITPVAGDYLVWFSTSLDSTSNDSIMIVSIYSGGSLVAHTPRKSVTKTSGGLLGGNINLASPVATHCKVTVNGSQAIEGRWKVSAGTATAHQRTLNILRIA